MKNIDVRKLDKGAREQLRRTAIRMLKQGQTHRAVSAHLGVNRTTITAWAKRHSQGGEAALSEKKSGRPVGCGRSLSPAQEALVQRKLVDYSPDQPDFGHYQPRQTALHALPGKPGCSKVY
jgi:transposase-like protein